MTDKGLEPHKVQLIMISQVGFIRLIIFPHLFMYVYECVSKEIPVWTHTDEWVHLFPIIFKMIKFKDLQWSWV